jgi:hypothetical protein
MFYFEQIFQTALGGIDSANVTSTVLSVASAVLLLSFLYSAYEAFAAGGDVRMLATSGIKYLILGLVFANYGTAFRSVNSMFNSVADFIYNSSGTGDVFSDWLNQLSQYWQANGNSSVWSMVTGAASGIISLVLILASFVIFPFCYLIFAVSYAMYGSVLYVTGPLILALLPTRGLGPLARTYLVNMMTFQAWGLIYAIIQVLMSAVNLNSINSVLNANGVLNSFVGSSQMMLLAMTACLFSLSIALIPFIASRIVRGDVGSTMLTLVSTVTTAGSAVAASFAGVGEGVAAAQGAAGGAAPAAPAASVAPSLGSPMSPPIPSGGMSGAGLAAPIAASSTAPFPGSDSVGASAIAFPNGGTSSESGANVPASAPAAATPSQPRSRPGVYRGSNMAHALAWHAGYSIGKSFRQE